MNNSVFGKTMENVRKRRDTTDEKRNKLVSDPNYHAIEMKKARVKMNKPLYLGMSMLDIRKTRMYGFWYDYIKPKHGDRAELCYMGTDRFVIHSITEDIANGVKRWSDTSNYDENDKIPLPIGKNKKITGFFKDELGAKIMEEFCALRAKTYAYLINCYNDDGYDKE